MTVGDKPIVEIGRRMSATAPVSQGENNVASFLSNIKIGTRLALGFGLVIVAGLLGAGYGRIALSDVGREVRLLNEDRVVKVLLARDLRDNALLIAERARNVVMLSDAAAMDAEVKQIESIRATNGQLIERLDAIVTSERGRALLRAAACMFSADQPGRV